MLPATERSEFVSSSFEAFATKRNDRCWVALPSAAVFVPVVEPAVTMALTSPVHPDGRIADKPFHAKRKERESPQTDNSTHTFGAAGADAVHTDQHVPQDAPALKSLHVGNDSGHGQLNPPKSWLQSKFVGLPARTISPLCTEGKPAHGPYDAPYGSPLEAFSNCSADNVN